MFDFSFKSFFQARTPRPTQKTPVQSTNHVIFFMMNVVFFTRCTHNNNNNNNNYYYYYIVPKKLTATAVIMFFKIRQWSGLIILDVLYLLGNLSAGPGSIV